MKLISLLLLLFVSLTSLAQTQWSVAASQGIQQMDIDANDNIYVLNYNRIYRIDALPTNGTRLVTQVATISGWATQWDGPTGLTIDKVNNKLYVLHGNYNTYTGNARILVADISNAPATITFNDFFSLGAYVYSGRLAYNNGYVYYVHAHGNQDIKRIQVSNPTSASTVFNCSGWGDHNLESSSMTFDQNGSLYFGETSARDKVYKINNPNVAVTPATLSDWDNLVTTQNSNIELIADYLSSAQYDSHYPTFHNGMVFISKNGNQLDKYNVSANNLTTQNVTCSSVYVITSDGTLYYASGTTIQKSTAANLTASIAATPSSLSGFSTCAGIASAEQTTSVSATGIGSNLTVTAPNGYEISLTSGTGFSASLTLIPTSGTVSATTIYVRLNATATGGTFNGNMVVASGSTFSNIALNGIKNLNTALTASSTPSICPNATITNITITTTGATSIGAASGLPTGISAAFSGNTITISGQVASNATPQAYNFTIPLQGGCGTVNATGTITVMGNIAVSSTNLPNFNSASIGGTAVTALTYTCTNVTSYQWFSNTINSNTGGIAISGATSSTYTPPSTIAELGTKYYYCQATGCSSNIVSGVATVNVFRNYYSKASATDFNDVTSWGINTDGTGTAPSSIDNTGSFILQNNSQLALSGNATVRSLTINTGKLTVASNTLTITIANQNNTELNVTSGGTLEVTGGSIVLNGAAYFANGSGLTQSGGLIVLYPNSGAGATSIGGVSSANIAFGIGYAAGSTSSSISTSANALKFNCTGGTIQIVDPAASTNAGVASFAYQASAGNHVIFGSNHTVKFGDGLSNIAGGSVNGFLINTRVVSSGGYLSFGNFVVDVLNGTNRKVINAGSSSAVTVALMVTENLTVTSGEYRQNVVTYISGNLTNEGNYISQFGQINFAKYINDVESPATNAQIITGNGYFYNTGTTAPNMTNFSSMSFNNTSAGGVTFASANALKSQASFAGTLSAYLYIKNGVIHTGNNTLFHTQPNAVSYTAGGFGSGSTYARLYTTTGSGTTISSGNVPAIGVGTYPFVSGNPVDGMKVRHFHRSTAALSAAGFIAVKFTEGSGLSPLSTNFTETVVYDQQLNSTWEVTTTGTITGNAIYCIQAQDAFPTSTAHVVIVRNGAQVGAASNGSTYPMGQRGGLSAANQIGTFKLATSSQALNMTWTGATSTDWATASNWSPAVVPTGGTATIPSSGIVNFPIASNVTINSGKTTTVQSGAQLTVTGTLTNNGTLTIESGATFLQGTSLAGTGTYNVKQFVTGAGGATPTGRFWYMGVPVNNLDRVTAFGTASGSNRLWSWSESGQAWSSQLVDATALTPTTGYSFRSGSDVTLNFSGTSLYSADPSISGLTNTTGSFSGCHLMSNPFTAYADWEQIYSASTNISSTYCVRSFNTANSQMVYDTYNATGDVAVQNGSYAVTRYIAPMQSFWIIVDPSTTGTFNMTKSMLSHQPSATGLKDLSTFNAFARLNLIGGNLSDQVVVYMTPDATNTLDAYDSKKMMLSNVPQVYTTLGNDKLVINGLKESKAHTIVPLTLELPTSQSYHFEMAESNVNYGLVILEDREELVFQDMTANPDYAFFAQAGISSDRFVLHFHFPLNTASTDEIGSSAQIDIVSNNTGAVNVHLSDDLQVGGEITVLDQAGRLVAKKTITQAQTLVQINETAGVYFVRVQTPGKTEMKKVVLY
ncbi:MAG: T9SS type A sorting domain-containing protein [Crocinitomicaceae bacterium]|nr:T9SS type A sorting domain-containing protein [Crocinitomicaceae bacterium]MBP6032374.1 T9SS type A sorting domain-containing protein [Crocinitomicaceae bacterium]